MRSAIKRVALRHGYDLVLERGAVVLRPGLTDVAIADITPEVVFEVARP
jgi:Skp family chaperone for outer membrane proteins